MAALTLRVTASLGLAPGTYFLLFSTRYNGQFVLRDSPADVKAGAHSFTLDPRNATPINNLRSFPAGRRPALQLVEEIQQ